MVENLLVSPGITTSITIGQSYNILGAGTTDNVYLVGHADGLALNEPYPVLNINDAILAMKSNLTSPLLLAMLEAYYCGARDIWLVAAAPMNEYVQDLTQRLQPKLTANFFNEYDSAQTFDSPSTFDSFLDFYQQYALRLEDTYEVLLNLDSLDILHILEAPLYPGNSTDFLTPLASLCFNIFENSGDLTIGIIDTRGAPGPQVDNLVSDTRISRLGVAGKQILTVIGEGVFNFAEVPTVYNAGLGAAVAGTLAGLPLYQALTYRRLNGVYQLTYPDFNPGQVSRLTNAKFNPAIRNGIGKRGTPYNNVILTDNTLGTDGTDFWSVSQVRLVARVMEKIRDLGRRYLGTIGFGQFKMDTQNYLRAMQLAGNFRNFSVVIDKDSSDPTNAIVNLSITPYFGIRQVSVSILVGPGL